MHGCQRWHRTSLPAARCPLPSPPHSFCLDRLFAVRRPTDARLQRAERARDCPMCEHWGGKALLQPAGTGHGAAALSPPLPQLHPCPLFAGAALHSAWRMPRPTAHWMGRRRDASPACTASEAARLSRRGVCIRGHCPGACCHHAWPSLALHARTLRASLPPSRLARKPQERERLAARQLEHPTLVFGNRHSLRVPEVGQEGQAGRLLAGDTACRACTMPLAGKERRRAVPLRRGTAATCTTGRSMCGWKGQARPPPRGWGSRELHSQRGACASAACCSRPTTQHPRFACRSVTLPSVPHQSLTEEEERYIEKVVVRLHPTFRPSTLTLTRPPFAVRCAVVGTCSPVHAGGAVAVLGCVPQCGSVAACS